MFSWSEETYNLILWVAESHSLMEPTEPRHLQRAETQFWGPPTVPSPKGCFMGPWRSVELLLYIGNFTIVGLREFGKPKESNEHSYIHVTVFQRQFNRATHRKCANPFPFALLLRSGWKHYNRGDSVRAFSQFLTPHNDERQNPNSQPLNEHDCTFLVVSSQRVGNRRPQWNVPIALLPTRQTTG